MLKNISNFGKVINKKEQKSINGGWVYITCIDCQPLPPGFICMNKPFCGGI